MDQSLFTRFVRLGVPYYQLNAQGRARPRIAALYNWRYDSLGDLPHVSKLPRFRAANPGFVYPFQLINVPDVDGEGETEPMPYFFQASRRCSPHRDRCPLVMASFSLPISLSAHARPALTRGS